MRTATVICIIIHLEQNKHIFNRSINFIYVPLQPDNKSNADHGRQVAGNQFSINGIGYAQRRVCVPATRYPITPLTVVTCHLIGRQPPFTLRATRAA